METTRLPEAWEAWLAGIDEVQRVQGRSTTRGSPSVNHPELMTLLDESVQGEEADITRMQDVLAHHIEEEAGRKGA